MKKYILWTITLLLVAVGVKATPTAQAVWVEGNKTLYFIYLEPVSVGDTFDGKTVTNVWSGTDVTATGTSEPTWKRTVRRDVVKVKFDNSFKNVKPTSFYSWFWGFEKLTNLDGLGNLDTSEATTMNSMFFSCSSLKTINVNTFDMGKVTDVGDMFWGCNNLTTITCDKTWNFDNDHSSSMFWTCSKLKGAREYSNATALGYDATMANPVTGYFTLTDGTTMSGAGTEDDPIQLSNAMHWDVVGNFVAAGKNCSSLHFQMADIFTVTTVIGTSDHPFNGTFDGNCKLLTANIDGGTNIHTAPFAYIAGATIKGVTVDGTIKGGRHSAGLVGNVVSGTNVVTDCYVVKGATITTTDSHAGGIIGHGQSATLTVSGCVFEGTVKKETAAAQYVGAIVGWCDTNSGITVSDCFELGTYTNFTNKGMNYKWTTGSNGTTFGGTHCYSTNALGGATKVYEIDGAEDLAILTPVRQAYTTTLTFYGTNEKAGGFCFRQIDEIYEGMIWDIDYEYYAAKDDVVKFTAQTSNVTVKGEDDNDVTVTGDNTTESPLQFTMPGQKVTMSANAVKYAYALWCGELKTLHFTYTSDDIKVGDTYDNIYTVTEVWKGNDVLAVGWGTPKWSSKDVSTVVFDASFAEARPTSLFKWFCHMWNLSTIRGLEYLNTSEVTNMNSMFYACTELEAVDVDNFDVSKVTNATSMFYRCEKLTTIYCSKSWDINTAKDMFLEATALVGAVKYNENETGGNMANPSTGYFTQPDNKAYAIYCADNNTLYFTTSETALNVNDTYQGHTITNLWNGTDVTNTGTGSQSPGWEKTIRESVKHVVFDQSFSSIKPKSLAYWFRQMYYLEDITGLQYLNTSEATSTHTMFCEMRKITTLDLTNFDMSKVTDATQMFYGCQDLTTIYCNDTWTVTSTNMFQNCPKLKGAVSYDSERYSSAMANPYTGYFTAVDSEGNPKDPYELATTDDWNCLAAYVKAGKSCSGKTFKMTADFEAGEMIGTSEHPFGGTFDGAGYTLTVEYGSESEPFNEDYCAPFRYVGYGAKIQGLVVTGDIYTSAKNGAGVVGQAYNETTLDNILCTVNIHSTVSGVGYHGGLVAHVNSSNSMGTTIQGCSFQGSLLGSNTTSVGGFVGYKEASPYLTIFDSFFAPKEVAVSASGSYTFAIDPNVQDNNLTIGQTCYYTTTLGTTQGQKALKITDESESCFIKNIDDYYNVSMIITHTDGTSAKTKTSMMVFVVDEIDDGDIEGEYQWLAASGGNIYIESTANNLAIKDADGGDVTLTKDSDNNYHFTMPSKDVTITGGGSVAYAIWCDGNKTLYFDYSATLLEMGGTYQGQTITQVWSGNDVLNTGWSTPKWSNFAYSATTVVFTEEFANVKPTSMNRWFFNFKNLTAFTGLANLNTSKVTVMNSTFYDCDALTNIDVNSFDVGKVTNASAMFCSCDNLVTIYCDKTWNISTTLNMFNGCTNLKSHNLNYDSNKTNGDMANPYTGYFTPSNLEIELANNADNTELVEKFSSVSVDKVTLAGRTLWKDGTWNTLTLPFNADLTDDDCPLKAEGVEARELTSASITGTTLYLTFTPVTNLVAGTPYIIRWTNDTEHPTIYEPVFNGVTIDSTPNNYDTNTATPSVTTDTRVRFVGTYDLVTYAKGTAHTNVLFMGADNNLYYPDGVEATTIGACRAYFLIGEDGNSAPALTTFNIDFGDETTEITTTNLTNYTNSDAWYTIDGVKLSAKPTAKGIYINNGHKVVIK